MKTKPRILVVEDDPVDNAALRRAKLPYEIIMATSLEEAREVVASSQLDAIVTDFDVGDGTAVDVLALAPDVAAVVVTGGRDQERAIKALKAGAADLLVKDEERSYLLSLPAAIETAMRLKASEQSLRMLGQAMRSIGDAVYVTTNDDKIVFVNPAFSQMYGYGEGEAMGATGDLLWEERPESDRMGGRDKRAETYLRRKSGTKLPVALTRSQVKNDAGQVIATVRVTRDMSERERIERALRDANAELEKSRVALAELAIRDELTGLFNRRELMRALKDELARYGRTGQPLSLVLLDVDHFKNVNDRYGHPAGDDVLRRVAKLVENNIRTLDRAARYGGEEIAVLLPHTPAKGAEVVAERIRVGLEAMTVRWGGQELRVTASFGIASVPEHADNEADLVAAADAALYAAKAAGRNRVVRAGGKRAA